MGAQTLTLLPPVSAIPPTLGGLEKSLPVPVYVVPFWNYLTFNIRDLEICVIGTIRKPGCGFLFAFHSNCGRIFRSYTLFSNRIEVYS